MSVDVESGGRRLPRATPPSRRRHVGSPASLGLGVVLLILADPDLLQHSGIARNLASDTDGVAQGSFHAALPDDGDDADDTSPQEYSEDHSCPPHHDAFYPDHELEGHKCDDEDETEHDNVGGVVECARDTVHGGLEQAIGDVEARFGVGGSSAPEELDGCVATKYVLLQE